MKKLRVIDWDGPMPEPYDCLRTVRGRIYEVVEVHGRTLHCRVLDDESKRDPNGRMFNWRWTPRKKKHG